jgi:L-arabinose isomerase
MSLLSLTQKNSSIKKLKYHKMNNLKHLEVWFLTGTQNLYGEETLKQVVIHSQAIAQYLDQAPSIPVKVIFKPILKSSEEIYDTITAANLALNCIGIITWMHTPSPLPKCG